MTKTLATFTKAARWAVGAAALVWSAQVMAADVQVGINLGIPAPPVVIATPPRLVVVPGAPTVQYAPDLQLNYFAYGGEYYAYNDGAWFTAPTIGAPWVYLPTPRVPRPLLGVPVRYYRVPPGRFHRGDHDRRDDDRHEHDRRDDDGHDRGRHRGWGHDRD